MAGMDGAYMDHWPMDTESHTARELATATGLAAILIRSKGYTRILATAIGVTGVIVSLHSMVRILTTSIGLAVTQISTHSHVRSLVAAAIGLASILSYRTRAARPVSSVGTDRTRSSTGTDRTVTTVGDDRNNEVY